MTMPTPASPNEWGPLCLCGDHQICHRAGENGQHCIAVRPDSGVVMLCKCTQFRPQPASPSEKPLAQMTMPPAKAMPLTKQEREQRVTYARGVLDGRYGARQGEAAEDLLRYEATLRELEHSPSAPGDIPDVRRYIDHLKTCSMWVKIGTCSCGLAEVPGYLENDNFQRCRAPGEIGGTEDASQLRAELDLSILREQRTQRLADDLAKQTVEFSNFWHEAKDSLREICEAYQRWADSPEAPDFDAIGDNLGRLCSAIQDAFSGAGGASDDASTDAEWVVWSVDHRAWWGPDQAGYTPNLLDAGIYTEQEAKWIQSQSSPRAGSELPPGAVSDVAKSLRGELACAARSKKVVAYLLHKAAFQARQSPSADDASTDADRLDWLEANTDTTILNGSEGVGIYRQREDDELIAHDRTLREAIDKARHLSSGATSEGTKP